MSSLYKDRSLAIAKAAVLSRVITFLVGILSNLIIEDYDSSVRTIFPDTRTATWVQRMVISIAQVFVRWDSVYFVHIADSGYVYEQEHAFFPLLPVLMRILSRTVLAPLDALIGRRLCLVAAGIAVSNIAFVCAAVALYRLGTKTLSSERHAYVGALFFVMTPSNMFMSAIYSESLFACVAFVGMIRVAEKRYISAALWFCASTLCRSNGVCYAGFFAWHLVVKDSAWHAHRVPSYVRAARIAAQASKAIALSLLSSLGFVAFQVYGFRIYCSGDKQSLRPYCNKALPFLYNFVQSEYWDVGFLRYYTVQQIPNFVLALPMIGLSAAGIWVYVKHDVARVLSLGWATGCRATGRAFLSDDLLPHIYLWAFLLFVGTTNMHVQVITRFLSCQPTVFWFAAHVACMKCAKSAVIKWRRVLVFYFVGYGLVGIVLFSNFFPPA